MLNLIKIVLYQPLYNVLMFLAFLIPGHSIGWAIIVLTILIRLILLPNSIKAAKAQARLQALQPKVNAIKKQIKNAQDQNKAIMQLYKDENVSPFGSCLPQLIQLPILIVLYQVFRQGLSDSSMSMLYSFVPHLDSVNTYFYGLNLIHPEKWVLPILAGATQYVLSMMMMPKAIGVKSSDEDPTQMAMKQMNYIFPLMNVFLGRILPAAVTIYWVITTVFSIIQQWYVNEHIKSLPKAEVAEYLEEKDPEDFAVAVKEDSVESVPAKKDYLTRVMGKRLDKAERKAGVNVTIRKKSK